MTDLKKTVSYRLTIIACCLGNIVLASVINLTPVLFIPLREQFGLSFGQLGILIAVNFMTQVVFDIIFSGAMDKYGYRPFVVASCFMCIAGFLIFSVSPFVLKENPYIGFLIGTFVFSGAGGLLEILLSSIVNSIPSDEKSSAMSILHSFYSWGQLGIILITSFLLNIFGRSCWPFIMLGFMIVPLLDAVLFIIAPMGESIPEGKRQGMSAIVKKPFFIVALLAILLGGASEVSMAQWASAFLEKALGIPKIIGDSAGLCTFALMMGIGRIYCGIKGNKIDMNNVLIYSSLGAVICFIIAAVSPLSVISLAACAACGLFVSMLWPGTLVISSSYFPYAGSWIFAILAAGGDIGASAGPFIMSQVTDNIITSGVKLFGQTPEQTGLRAAMLLGAVYSLLAFICHKYLKNKREVTVK